MVADPVLPPAYDGDYVQEEDSELYIEASRAWGNLTAAQQQALYPYIARPNDPMSVYSRPAVPLAAGIYADSSGIACPTNPDTNAADWRSTDKTDFTIWACGGGDSSIDPFAPERDIVGAIAEQVWGLETPGLGVPRTAAGKKVDVYILQQNQFIERADGSHMLSGTALAKASPDAPCDTMARGPALTSSGFIMVPLNAVPASAPDAGTPSQMRAYLAHEFFHLLSYGLNLGGQGGGCADGKYTGKVAKTFLTEASAAWAEWAYVPNDLPAERQQRFDRFQGRMPPGDSLQELLSGETKVSYDASVFPLSLGEDSGTRSTFEGFWTSSGSASDVDALEDLLDTQFPYQDHFRDMAVRMWNHELTGLPAGLIPHDVDAALPTDDGPRHTLPNFTLLPGNYDFPFKAAIARSAAQYQTFTVPDLTRWVDIDLGGAKISLDALVDVKDTWSRRRPEGTRFVFCRDDPNDDISAFTLIISNYEHKQSNPLLLDYTIKARDLCPNDTFTGWIKSSRTSMSGTTYMGTTTDHVERYEEVWTLGAKLDPSTPGLFGMAGVQADWSGNYSYHDSSATAPCVADQGSGQTTDGGNGNTHETPLVFTPTANGGLVVSALHPDQLGSIAVTKTTVTEYCGAGSYTSMADETEPESFAAIQGAVMLMPTNGDPNHFVGKFVLAHSDTTSLEEGESIVDWTVTWDINRTLK
jgi:hypothetical protein